MVDFTNGGLAGEFITIFVEVNNLKLVPSHHKTTK